MGRGIASPLSWCLGFHVVLTEVVSLNYTGAMNVASSYSALGVLGYSCIGIVLSVVLIIASIWRPVLPANAVLPIVAGVVGSGCTVVLLMQGLTDLPHGARLASYAGAVLSVELLFYLILGRLRELPIARVKEVIVASALISAALVPLYRVPNRYLMLIGIALFLLCSLLLCFRIPCGCVTGGEVSPKKRCVRFPGKILFGVALIVVSFAFSQSQLYFEEVGIVTAVIALTKIVALIIFACILLAVHDLGYARSLKTTVMLIASALVFFLQGDSTLFAYALMATGYSLFELVEYMALADLASSSTVPPLRIFAVVNLVVNGCYALGSALGLFFDGVSVEKSIVASILLVLLVYVAVWHFTEERVNDFFAGELPASVEEESSRQFERETEVARRYRLTSREQEILDLYARGRSAVFIAEQLSISPATVRSHVKHIYEKCLVHSRQELLSLIDGQALE